MYSMFNDAIQIQYEEDLDKKKLKISWKILVKEFNSSKAAVKLEKNQKTWKHAIYFLKIKKIMIYNHRYIFLLKVSSYSKEKHHFYLIFLLKVLDWDDFRIFPFQCKHLFVRQQTGEDKDNDILFVENNIRIFAFVDSFFLIKVANKRKGKRKNQNWTKKKQLYINSI